MKNPAKGGTYFKATEDSEAIFVRGTDREPTAEEKKALKAAEKKGKTAAQDAEKD